MWNYVCQGYVSLPNVDKLPDFCQFVGIAGASGHLVRVALTDEHLYNI
jgi:hypothetical protein